MEYRSGSINFVLTPKVITRSCQLFFSSVTEFINRTILTVNLHILDQWNQQENDIRMSDDWWFWFISISPILNAFRLDQFFFSRVFSFGFLKNVKYEKSMYNNKFFIHTLGVPNLHVYYYPGFQYPNFWPMYTQMHTAGSNTIFVQIYMDPPPGVPGVWKNQIFFHR